MAAAATAATGAAAPTASVTAKEKRFMFNPTTHVRVFNNTRKTNTTSSIIGTVGTGGAGAGASASAETAPASLTEEYFKSGRNIRRIYSRKKLNRNDERIFDNYDDIEYYMDKIEEMCKGSKNRFLKEQYEYALSLYEELDPLEGILNELNDILYEAIRKRTVDAHRAQFHQYGAIKAQMKAGYTLLKEIYKETRDYYKQMRALSRGKTRKLRRL
jgi:hypothetical protein